MPNVLFFAIAVCHLIVEQAVANRARVPLECARCSSTIQEKERLRTTHLLHLKKKGSFTFCVKLVHIDSAQFASMQKTVLAALCRPSLVFTRCVISDVCIHLLTTTTTATSLLCGSFPADLKLSLPTKCNMFDLERP